MSWQATRLLLELAAKMTESCTRQVSVGYMQMVTQEVRVLSSEVQTPRMNMKASRAWAQKLVNKGDDGTADG